MFVRMLLVSMLLFVMSFPALSYGEAGDEAAMMATARGHYNEGGYYYATTWLERLLKNWPNTSQREEVLLMMAKAYVATAREEKALQTIAKLQKDFPQSLGKLDPVVVKFMEESGPRVASSPYVNSPYGSGTAAAVPVGGAPGAKQDPVQSSPASEPARPAASESARMASDPVPPAPAAVPSPVAVPAPVPVPVPVPVPAPEVVAKTAGKAVETQTPAMAEVSASETAQPARAAGDVPAVAPAAKPAAEIAEVVEVAEAPKPVPAPAKPEVPSDPVEAKHAAAQVKAPAQAAPVTEPARKKKAVAAVPSAKPAPAKPAVVATQAAPSPSQAVQKPAAKAVPAKTDTKLGKGAEKEASSTCQAGAYVIELGEFVGQNFLVAAKKKVRKAGLLPVVGTGAVKQEMMLRIQVGQFRDQAAAQKLVGKLKSVKADHFVLQDNTGTFRVFAGSYVDLNAAAKEQERLAAKGVDSELKEASVPVSTYALSAGCFSSEEAAKGKLAELENLGLKGKVAAAP